MCLCFFIQLLNISILKDAVYYSLSVSLYTLSKLYNNVLFKRISPQGKHASAFALPQELFNVILQAKQA